MCSRIYENYQGRSAGDQAFQAARLLRGDNEGAIEQCDPGGQRSFFGLLAVYLGKDVSWDLRNYHYYNVYAFLNDRLKFDGAPAQVQRYLNPILDFPFYFFSNTFPPKLVGFLMGALHGINFWLIYLIGKSVLGACKKFSPAAVQGAALACAALGMYSPTGISTLGTTSNDLFMSQFVLGAVYFSVTSLQRNRLISWRLICGGLLMGLGVGSKLVAAVFAPPLLLSAFLFRTSWRFKVAGGVLAMSAMILGFLATGGWWAHFLYQEFNNPFFPYWNGVFKSEYWEPVNFTDVNYLPRNLGQAILYPFYFLQKQKLISSQAFRDARYAVVYTWLLVLTFWLALGATGKLQRFHEWRCTLSAQDRAFYLLVLFFVASYVLWLATFSYARYAAPLELLAPLVILILSVLVFSSRLDVGMKMCGACFVLIALLMEAPAVGRQPWTEEYFGVVAPEVREDSEVIAIMTGTEPYACFIPFFAGNVRFLRIQSNFLSPEQDNRLMQEMRGVIRAHDGPVYLFSFPAMTASDVATLKEFGLEPVPDSCVGVRTLIHPPAEWTELKKSNQPPAPLLPEQPQLTNRRVEERASGQPGGDPPCQTQVINTNGTPEQAAQSIGILFRKHAVRIDGFVVGGSSLLDEQINVLLDQINSDPSHPQLPGRVALLGKLARQSPIHSGAKTGRRSNLFLRHAEPPTR